MTPRILLVEDDPDNAEIAMLACRSVGYEIEHAANGQEALDRLRHEPFDLVLVDLLMPGMDGVELTRVIRQQPALAHLPVIGVTAAVHAEALERLWAAGIDQLVTKPYRIHTLQEVVHLLLARQG